jgi:MFS family permease
MKSHHLVFLMLLISFGSVAAVAFTPGLVELATAFHLSESATNASISWYLAGYCLGQLFYGPLINYLGSKPTIRLAATIEIAANCGVIYSATIHNYSLFLICRLIMAIGAGGGLTLAFALARELSPTDKGAAQLISLLSIAFALTPGIGVFIGGILVDSFGWVSPFYMLIGYGLIILMMCSGMPELIQKRDHTALALRKLVTNYKSELNLTLINGGLLVAAATATIYTFASLGPQIAIKFIGLTPKQYGSFNFLPVAGMIVGSLLSHRLAASVRIVNIIKCGLLIAGAGSALLYASLTYYPHSALALFAPVMIIYIGLSLVFSHASTLGLSQASSKSNASALLSFINLSGALGVVLLTENLCLTSPATLSYIFISFMLLASLALAMLSVKSYRLANQ